MKLLQHLRNWMSPEQPTIPEDVAGPGIADLGPCSLPRPLDLPSQASVLVIAPHPDDETIGCGGTIARLNSLGCRVTVLLVTDGSGADRVTDCDVVATRRQETRDALEVLGGGEVVCWDFPDGKFVDGPHYRQALQTFLQQEQPDWVFFPSPLDYHRDHVGIAVGTFATLQAISFAGRALLYEIWGSLPGNRVVDITDVMPQKRRALEGYRIPLAHCDYLTAGIGLAAFRGIMVGREPGPGYAEVFLDINGQPELFERLLHLRLQLEARLTA